jgi:hypothetical protein
MDVEETRARCTAARRSTLAGPRDALARAALFCPPRQPRESHARAWQLALGWP